MEIKNNCKYKLCDSFSVWQVDVDRALDTPGTKRCYSVRLRSFRDVQYYSDAYDWTLELYGDLGQILSPGLELESPNLIIVIGGSLSHADKSLKLNCRMGSDESKIIHFVRNVSLGLLCADLLSVASNILDLREPSVSAFILIFTIVSLIVGRDWSRRGGNRALWESS